jgi:hypothetical protein
LSITVLHTSGQRERVLHLHHTPKGQEYVNIERFPLLNAHGEQAFMLKKWSGCGWRRVSRQPRG